MRDPVLLPEKHNDTAQISTQSGHNDVISVWSAVFRSASLRKPCIDNKQLRLVPGGGVEPPRGVNLGGF